MSGNLSILKSTHKLYVCSQDIWDLFLDIFSNSQTPFICSGVPTQNILQIYCNDIFIIQKSSGEKTYIQNKQFLKYNLQVTQFTGKFSKYNL